MAAPREDMPQLMDRLAELVANGGGVSASGRALGLTPGETANVWGRIKRGLGAQAS
ncbi:hypothetical protein [Novosphingobium sp. fls2-241-R2A-195]|uniref:hypothetical protein n=1 Tax=Novosphingobium sp. fls2-241-R2A-195 TaxID=3040296 RepID=UPI00254BC387|nr:hypothetical protein [Novosphingobium sp. fls2-241-R2A-195]